MMTDFVSRINFISSFGSAELVKQIGIFQILFEGFPELSCRISTEKFKLEALHQRWLRDGIFLGSGLWGNYLEPIFFLVLGNLKNSIKYGENSTWGNFHKFPHNPESRHFEIFLGFSV